jgi:HK97 gp10 family phage protein
VAELEITARADVSLLQQFRDTLPQKLEAAVRETAFTIEAEAKILAPVEFGALRASIYVDTMKAATREAALATARGLWAAGHLSIEEGESAADFAARAATSFPEAPEPPAPESPFEAIVGVGVEYGIHQEFGTVHSPAQPYMTPAVDGQAVPFRERVATAIADAVKGR